MNDRWVVAWTDGDGDNIVIRRPDNGYVPRRALLTVDTVDRGSTSVYLPDDSAELDVVLARIRAAALGQFQEET